MGSGQYADENENGQSVAAAEEKTEVTPAPAAPAASTDTEVTPAVEPVKESA